MVFLLLQQGAKAIQEPSDAASLSFLVLGDWGGPGSQTTPTPLQLGWSWPKLWERDRLSVYNFYDNGVQSVYDARFNETFEASL